MTAITALTRELLRDGHLQRLLASHPDIRTLTAEELALSRHRLLARRPPGGDVWLFAYGSLIWNPTFEHVESRLARVNGWHRSFCLWTTVGRGTPQHPGLTLGLERGGSCGGVVYRIAASLVEAELDLVWRREMPTGAYRPTWVRARTAEDPVEAITFVIDRSNDRYAGKLEEQAVASTLAAAGGPLGSCADYLRMTAARLAQLGIADRRLDRLCRLIDDGDGAVLPEASSAAPPSLGSAADHSAPCPD